MFNYIGSGWYCKILMVIKNDFNLVFFDDKKIERIFDYE